MINYATIMIKVKYHELDLTDEQRKQADNADRDIEAEHPLEKGMTNIELKLDTYLDDCFNYLGEGKEAVQISWLGGE